MSSQHKEKQKRSNLWVAVFYPDSAPKSYLPIIQSWHIPALISPVHDADLNADMSEKKPHIHLLLDFGSGQNKSFEQVKTYTDQIKGTIPFVCHNRAAMVRYFIHKDNPEKHQYDVNDLIALSGFEYMQAFENYTSEIQIYRFIENIIYRNMIYNYSVLCKYMNAHGYEYEYNFLRKHTLHFKALLDGQYQLLKMGRQIIVSESSDIDTYVTLKDIGENNE